jgi:hypothetical protein
VKYCVGYASRQVINILLPALWSKSHARNGVKFHNFNHRQIVCNIHVISLRSCDINQKFWEELITYFLPLHIEHLMRHRPHRKHLFQQFFYCRVCIRYCGIALSGSLPSNDKGDTQTHRQQGNLIIILFFQNKECKPQIKIDIFWNVAPYSLVNTQRRSRGRQALIFRVELHTFSTLKRVSSKIR